MALQQAPRHYRAELAIIGAGLAGCAAAIFARDRQIDTALVGNTGAIAYTTGYFDLLGMHPAGNPAFGADPWSLLDALRQEQPGHPYAKLDNDTIGNALQRFTSALGEMGVGYSTPGDTNLLALTPVGTTKPTVSVPLTMLPGVRALAQKAPTLFVGFHGLNGYSATQIAANLRPAWPQLRAEQLAFPDMETVGQLYPEVMARSLQVETNRARLAGLLSSVAGSAAYIGLPAICGVHRPDAVLADLQRRVDATLFELPTMPPGVPGIRLREMLQQALPERGVTLVAQQKVETLQLGAQGCRLLLHDNYGELTIEASAVILATGRFLSGGLHAERDRVRETLLGLHVSQPPGREAWFDSDYFTPDGHPINRAGVEVDRSMRALDETGEPVSERLFCAGSLLAHHDWVRQRCGAGIAIATAHKAVESASVLLGTQSTPGA